MTVEAEEEEVTVEELLVTVVELAEAAERIS